ncbi:NADPH:adrenodoxin oxidoreductase, mitochondrial-like [Gigantopelta aegis]|uniref:NADPH:adrenodoxin oxidoreductase, mitochondrial-like n=1 Tax=Gigantopelta aegis TaxID=1735272 RepID=UPI001B88CFC7|nr:NADPH:adrenodoxin oxidoreductase, mitochondrial-like [Gigantopelta aegis]XP_041363675.1 NADPH:adrenodoxin oxidoreductase, mitochondrial-like [Gigantopelta aegis]
MVWCAFKQRFLWRPLRRIIISARRHYCGTDKTPHVAIVGSGPAGFYTAQQLLKGHPSLRVDIYEKLPVPFGLVRYGVAPDHPEVKIVTNTFTETARNKRCSFIGNITVGKDITIGELQRAYTAVVLAYGADEDRKLGIPGEDLPNVLSARQFVGWYNGLPQDRDLSVDLSRENAVIIGHGNVAIDVCRILMTPIDTLRKTDISQYSLDQLAASNVKKVYMVGRRGPLQIALTIKELREMIRLPECRTIIHKEDVLDLDKVISDLPRPRRRLTELLHKTGVSPSEKDSKHWATASREWELRFCLSPVEIRAGNAGKSVEGVRFCVNRLEGEDIVNKKAVPTDKTVDIECGLVLRSIGFRSIPIDSSVPFDSQRGIIPNQNGRILGTTGLYCSGWVGLGPVGVILTTMTDGFEKGKLVLKDIEEGRLDNSGKNGRDQALDILKQRGVQVVSFSDWECIDEAECKNGQQHGKPREKMADTADMLKAVCSSTTS